MIEFFHTVRSFIYEYLPKQKSVSENTKTSYNTAIELFVTFMREEKKYSAKEISFLNIDRELIIEFLDWLEKLVDVKPQHEIKGLWLCVLFSIMQELLIVHRQRCISTR